MHARSRPRVFCGDFSWKLLKVTMHSQPRPCSDSLALGSCGASVRVPPPLPGVTGLRTRESFFSADARPVVSHLSRSASPTPFSLSLSLSLALLAAVVCDEFDWMTGPRGCPHSSMVRFPPPRLTAWDRLPQGGLGSVFALTFGCRLGSLVVATRKRGPQMP